MGTASRGRWPGFGCLFGLLFLFVVGSLLAMAASSCRTLGPFPGSSSLVLVVVLLVGIGRTLPPTGRTLDQLVDATRRVEAGDYSVRVGPARRGAVAPSSPAGRPASTRWPRASRPTSASGARCSPTSATSCGRR